MSISFTQIPANIRNPLAYVELSNTRAGTFQQNSRSLIIAQSTNTITEIPVLVAGIDWAKQQYGAGSHAAIMVENFRKNNPFKELWILPLNDAGSSVAATSTITITTTSVSAGTIVLYIGHKAVYAPVLTNDTPTNIAASIVTVINANKDLPVTASNVAGVVTVTSKNKGTLGNKLVIQTNWLGNIANETTPAGVTVSITQPANGATDPTISTKLPLIGDLDIAFYISPYADVTSLQAFQDFLTARWNALVGKDGQYITATAATSSYLAATLGVNRNDQYSTIFGYESTNPTHPVYMVSALGAVSSDNLSNDPARTLQTLQLVDVAPTKEQDRFNLSTRATLLNSGISTITYGSGSVQIERAITTYQKNSFGQADNSYLDVTTLSTLSYIKKSVKYLLTQKFPRSKLAADGTNFGAGQAIVTPADIKAELIAWYDKLEEQGLVQNIEAFEDALVVELNATDPNRVDILLPPVLVNNLIIAAVRVDFRLQA